MAGVIYTSTIAKGLKLTLDKIPTDRNKDELIMPKYFDEGRMADNFVDDQEYGGPGLAAEKDEGAEIALGTLNEGSTYRYNSRTFALKMIASEEALEDEKYKDIIMAAKRLNRTIYKTVDVDAALQLVRAWDSNYVFGDGVSLCNTAHPLPGGSTFSNTLATAMAPSEAALIVMEAQAMGYPGHDGVTEGYDLKRVLHPKEQRAVWSKILNSTHAIEAGQFNAINTANRDMNLTQVNIKYWDTTETNFMVQTDCDEGFRWLWRVKPASRSWTNNDFTEVRYATRARWSRGHSNPRCVIGSQA